MDEVVGRIGSAMKIDVLITASPNDSFYSQVAMIRVALDSLGGAYRDARVVAVFGDRAVVHLPDKWAPYFERIDVAWTNPADFAAMGYHGTGLRRFEACREDADVVVLAPPTAGKVTIRWPGDDVRTLLAGKKTWTGVWDLQLSSPPGDPTTVAAGSFGAEMDVTR